MLMACNKECTAESWRFLFHNYWSFACVNGTGSNLSLSQGLLRLSLKPSSATTITLTLQEAESSVFLIWNLAICMHLWPSQPFYLQHILLLSFQILAVFQMTIYQEVSTRTCSSPAKLLAKWSPYHGLLQLPNLVTLDDLHEFIVT